ncbi:hypothetical protein CYLTODRAFT_425042 [Cylindrobasidium torrendii FP15055 ss-10]|uniref:Uncharacterized protein n=1 Tax=Cylindrobasidium torrendii FP15055 ss-10 TaxID=1314674 RepID=A0A0D7B1Y4_9AGAR|nr:hypothetical protein CYLTODRAFT_425042 [Cylindrobasidium torrendii FP15055 ss-10]
MDLATTVIHESPEFLRRANYVLDVDDIDAVRAEERQLNEEISKLNEEVQTYQDKLAFHRQKLEHYTKLLQDAQNRKKDACSALVRDQRLLLPSSMRAVPNEVLSNIFIQYLAMIHAKESDELRRSHSYRCLWIQTGRVYIPHTVLRLVCRRWNSVAVSEPHLWQTVPLMMPPSAFNPDLGASKALDDEYQGHVARNIARARTLPLDLQVRIARKKGTLSPSVVYDFLRRLMDLLPRTTYLNLEFESVTFDSDEDVLASIFPLPSRSDEFAVTNLVAKFLDSPQCKLLGRWILSLMVHMPMLNFARLPSMRGSLHATEIFPSGACYSRLSTVQLRDTTADVLAGLFACAHSLTGVRIDSLWAASANFPLLRHDTLSELSITEHNSAYRLQQFTLPALRKLEIGNPKIRAWSTHLRDCVLQWPQDAISRFFTQSRCLLTELVIHCRLTEPENIMPFLSSQSSLHLRPSPLGQRLSPFSGTYVAQHFPSLRTWMSLCQSSMMVSERVTRPC